MQSSWKRLFSRILITLSFAIIVGLAFWAPEPRGELGAPDEGVRCRAKIRDLASAANLGHPETRTLTEREINARLAGLLAHNQKTQQNQGLTVNIDELRVDLEPDHSTLFIVGNLTRLPLVFEARFTPTQNDPAKAVKLDKLRLGHLPLVGPFKMFIAHRMNPLFSRLRNEQVVLSHLDSCHMADDQVTLQVGMTRTAFHLAPDSR